MIHILQKSHEEYHTLFSFMLYLHFIQGMHQRKENVYISGLIAYW